MKIIHVLLIIILVFGAILGVKIYNGKNTNEITKEEQYSIQDVQKILEKADDITNYECELDLGEFTYYKKKDNKIFLEGKSGLKQYRDYDENIQIALKNNEREKVYLESNISLEKIPSSNLYTSTVDTDELSSVFGKVLNAQKEEYNGTSCLKVELESKDKEDVAVFWINLENGLIMKIKFYDGDIREYEYKFNTVTDEDINPPDLTGYKKIDFEPAIK